MVLSGRDPSTHVFSFTLNYCLQRQFFIFKLQLFCRMKCKVIKLWAFLDNAENSPFRSLCVVGFRTTRHHTFVSYLKNNGGGGGGGGCGGCGHCHFLIKHLIGSICRVHTVRQSVVQEY